ncbi:hypothetical protein TNCV_160211 [Trichonephila clavipes]|nr:hypothetical protein TNCV_160211 [Trichonephila clavipes]
MVLDSNHFASNLDVEKPTSSGRTVFCRQRNTYQWPTGFEDYSDCLHVDGIVLATSNMPCFLESIPQSCHSNSVHYSSLRLAGSQTSDKTPMVDYVVVTFQSPFL